MYSGSAYASVNPVEFLELHLTMKKNSPATSASLILGRVAKLLSPAGPHARLSILIYHRVLPEADPMLPTEPDSEAFAWQMQVVARHFTVIHLSEAAKRLKAGDLPSRALSITFDDGYANNASVALPILQEYGLPATFFITSGYLNSGRLMWNDTIIEALRQMSGQTLDLRHLGLGTLATANMEQRRNTAEALIAKLKYLSQEERDDRVAAITETMGASLPTNLMMSDAQVQKLSEAGMEIGAHTVRHPILARLDDGTARVEIASSKEQLEAIILKPVRLFAYPNGKPGKDYNSRHVQMVREHGFTAAVSTAWGAARVSDDDYQLPRFTPWDKTSTRFLIRMIQNYTRRSSALRN
jgi:peptidoglycan/xylan/chitin deacetylase (PgdA/CDA1 family)